MCCLNNTLILRCKVFLFVLTGRHVMDIKNHQSYHMVDRSILVPIDRCTIHSDFDMHLTNSLIVQHKSFYIMYLDNLHGFGRKMS